MGNHNNRGGNSFSGKRDFGGRGRDNDRGGRRDFGGDRERPQMHSAVCDDCGNNCEVPFRPTGDKPIFCSDCFRNKRGDDNNRDNSRGSRDGGRRDFGERRPRQDFGDKKPFKKEGAGSPDYNKQFEILNRKLDQIIKAISPVVIEEGAPVETSKKKKVDTKALKKELSDVMKPKTTSKKDTKKKVVKKAVKKVAKKVAVKKTVTKKVAKKTTAKKTVKKAVKKVAKKTATKKKK